jgi:hypothetical protein
MMLYRQRRVHRLLEHAGVFGPATARRRLDSIAREGENPNLVGTVSDFRCGTIDLVIPRR